MNRRFAVFLFVLACLLGVSLPLYAQDQVRTPQQFSVYAGVSGQGGIRLLSFIPSQLQVHQGDTVTWYLNGGLHNVRFTPQPEWLPLFLPLESNGQQRLIGNPAVLDATVETGATFTGEPLNSGAQIGESGVPFAADAPYAFSLVIDAEPGTHFYLCDVHPGMIASVQVVADDEPVPSPVEVAAITSSQMAAALAGATELLYEQEAGNANTAEDGVLDVLMGYEAMSEAGLHIDIDRFFPSTGVIQAGESVRWYVPEGRIIGHTVTAPYINAEGTMAMFEDADGNRLLEFTPALLFPTFQSEEAWPTQGQVNTGVVFAGQSFTARFDEPGVYPYADLFEPGMTGAIVVTDAE